MNERYYESANRMFFTLKNAQNSRMKAQTCCYESAHMRVK